MKVRVVVLPGGHGGAEGDGVVGAAGGAGECGGGVVVRVAVGARARGLEELGVGRRAARGGGAVRAAAAVLRVPEGVARAPARHGPVRRGLHPQARRARGVQLRGAPRRRALAAGCRGGGAAGRDDHGQVVPVHEADVVEVQPAAAVQRELRQRRGRGGAAAAALHVAGPAVPRGAREPPRGGVGGAERAAPEAARPPRGRRHGTGLRRRQREPRGGQRRGARAGQQPRPHRVAAVVRDGERRRPRAAQLQDQQERRECPAPRRHGCRRRHFACGMLMRACSWRPWQQRAWEIQPMDG
ncbi:uncharacterized protein LOC100284084 [Zea mays]|jgi:hypothetical protein|uniref:Uncharacterized protein n=1 Tax=Zea mays TaxID=4577 RepID=A0A804LPL6_MAIZE|nr:uncharacterized protein LOC100284084 [Zea mays]|eukprot:NP_001150454.2 uncharacterized protein LOC100284084 [Zea mays]